MIPQDDALVRELFLLRDALRECKADKQAEWDDLAHSDAENTAHYGFSYTDQHRRLAESVRVLELHARRTAPQELTLIRGGRDA